LAGPCDHTPEARELSEELEARFSEAGFGDTVRFAGLVSDPERYVRAADILAFPSRKEGLPNALIEAQASGLPAVASRLPGCTTDVVEDGETGLLVEPGEAQKLAAAARGRALERFNLDAVADAYRGLYGELPPRRGDASERSP
jgi:glycosyltransferase involved in cell wall biosynthesis